MSSWRVIPSLLSIVMALALAAGATAQRPDPHVGSQGTPEATATVTDCSATEAYAQDVLAAFNDAEAFLDFLNDFDVTFGMPEDEAEEVIASGDALIAELTTLTPPAAYQPAHDGIMSMVQFNVDVANFFAFDTSVVPDLNASTESWESIDAGEYAMAEACPAEVAEMGGYLVFEPTPLPTEIENLPE